MREKITPGLCVFYPTLSSRPTYCVNPNFNFPIKNKKLFFLYKLPKEISPGNVSTINNTQYSFFGAKFSYIAVSDQRESLKIFSL